ncbi:uncharacterized protein LOC117556017 [Gymnodraco acuticeps]|uniref:Uncharacterized protein LOC117556017 n=1 Tax=Gymnodraco acuticeps TaxID=8218 RepID=A0A6P8VNJ6_GYMAC|nr:uncharacterized protein LOC117556017 [Gymnodraco acuticeps]
MTPTTANISQSSIQLYSIYLELLNVLAEIHILNDSLFNFRIVNRVSSTLAYYMDNIEQQTNIPGFSIDACTGRPMPYFLKHRPKDPHRQRAIAVVVFRNGKKIKSELVYPVHRNNSASFTEFTKHSEEILFEEINQLLQKYGAKVRNIFIYTYYSPCLKRGNKYCDCMTQLVQKAYQWYRKFGIVTVVYFSEPWGPSGPDILKDLKYSDISSSSSALYPYVDQEIRFIVDTKELKQKNVFPFIKEIEDGKDEKKKLKEYLESANKHLCRLRENSKGFLKSQHLEHGLKYIDSLTFHKKVHKRIIETFKNNWIELVNYCSMSAIIKILTSVYNKAVVKPFLGDSGFLQIYQVPSGIEVEEGDYVELDNT